nr:phosphatidate cytidylyltransferase [Spelaeibacter cavernicola]
MDVPPPQPSESAPVAEAAKAEASKAGASKAEPSKAEPSKAGASKAGRNLPAAMGVGLTLGISLILILTFVPRVWIGVISVALAIATWEVARRLREADVLVPRIPLIVGGQAVIWLGWPYGAMGVLSSFMATVLACMVWRLFDHGLRATPRNFLRDTAITVFVAAWIPLLGAFTTLMVLEENGARKVLVFMIAVVCSDVGGYAAGVLFGKHPMVPAISPKKSWEGFAGSLVFCVIGCLLTVTLMLHANSLIGILLGVALVFVATMGDLIESQIKRELGIKDMGTLLPGHGGIMDRLDSLLPSAFVAWAVLTALV